jgi:hypothetical protein
MDKSFRRGKLPKFSAGRVDRDPHWLILIHSMAWTERRMASRASSLLQDSMVSWMSNGNFSTPPPINVVSYAQS